MQSAVCNNHLYRVPNVLVTILTRFTLQGRGAHRYCILVQLLVITVNIQFQSQPTSQNVMFWLKWTLACSFFFFQHFLKKMQKSCPKVGTRWGSHQWLIKFKAVSFLGPSKIKCQTTGRPRTCPPCHIPFAKSDYNPGRRRREHCRFDAHQNE